MGVYIKGIEMPIRPSLCPFYSSDPLGVRKPYCDIKSVCNGFDDCPLIPVPPHGRLGDLDKLEQMFVDINNAPYSSFDGSDAFYSAEDAAQIIRLAPTIIPAEEGET